MYCNHCGTQLPVGAGYCPNCQGPITEVRGRRVENHITLLAALWFAMGALRLLAALMIFVVSTFVMTLIMHQQQRPLPFPIQPLMLGIGALVAIIAVLSLLAGWGLHKREPWGRTMALVMAFLGLLSMPFGTALGIYTLVVLLPPEAGAKWEELSRSS